ncbi:hypothetical protein [Agrobacterium sp. CNPSo 3708]|uniref:hypothetical protein n=1 Tax=Agrobacterium sp. CNPSo 3708 TaxID=3028150 RepID=UPI003FCECAE0
MIEAVTERLEGAQGSSGVVGPMNLKNGQWLRRWSLAQAFQRLHIALAFIHHNYFAGVVMLAPDKGLFGGWDCRGGFGADLREGGD